MENIADSFNVTYHEHSKGYEELLLMENKEKQKKIIQQEIANPEQGWWQR